MGEKDWLLLKTLRDTRNITKAAEMLNTSQPGLSKRLRMIEERFGANIALRNRSGVEFTPAGEVLVEYAAAMLEGLRAVQERVNDIGSAIQGTLRIGASHSSISFILPKILSAFKKKYPYVEFLVTSAWSSDVIKLVGNGEVHVGFVRNDNAKPLPGRVLLCTEKTYICSTKEIDLARLPDEPQIAYKSDPFVTADLDLWWAENYKRPPKIAIAVDRLGASIEMVLNGLGYAFLTEKIVETMVGIYKYEIKHPDGQPYERRTWVIPNQDAKDLRLVAAFLEFVAGGKGDAIPE